MTDQDPPDPAFDRVTARLIQREALRRAAHELATTTPSGLEGVLARISAEVTAEAEAAKVDAAKVEAAKVDTAKVDTAKAGAKIYPTRND